MAGSVRLANEAWEALFRAQATIAQELERVGAWGDLLPREYGVLYALAGAPAGVRMTELAADVLLTQAGISRLINRLEGRGLIERHDDPDDARACRVALTAAGIELQRRVGRGHARDVANAMTRTLGTAELETIRDLSRALLGPSSSTQEGNDHEPASGS